MDDLLPQLQALAARLIEAQPLIVLGLLAGSALVGLWILRNLMRTVAAMLLLACVWVIFLPGGWPTLKQIVAAKDLRATARCGAEAFSSLDYWTLGADITSAPGCAGAGPAGGVTGGVVLLQEGNQVKQPKAGQLGAPKRAADALARRSAAVDKQVADAAQAAEDAVASR